MLCAADIFKSYNKPVLSGINFFAKTGQIVGIAGENGSGKSTLLSILTTVVKPDRGTVTIDDKNLFDNQFLLKQKIGYVPQENALFENLSVKDNLKFWAAAYQKQYKNVTFDEEHLNKKVKSLSGGLKKRLNITIALINNPEYLIMDEPTSSLDIGYKEEIMIIIKKLKAENKTIILTSHQPDELINCDKLYIIKNGNFIFSDSPELLNENGDFKGNVLKLIKNGRL